MSEDWRSFAVCREVDPELFFPEDGEPADEARQICASCTVLIPCRELGKREEYGVYGGVNRGARTIRTDGGCGTPSGLERHRRHNETPCDECREASRIYRQAWYEANRERRNAYSRERRQRERLRKMTPLA